MPQKNIPEFNGGVVFDPATARANDLLPCWDTSTGKTKPVRYDNILEAVLRATEESAGLIGYDGTNIGFTVPIEGTTLNFSGNATAARFNGNGAGLFSIPAGNLAGAAGSISTTLLHSNVVLANSAPTFTGNVTAPFYVGNGSLLTGIAGGGVGSIGLTMPGGFSVAGSPLTANGTLAVTTTLTGAVFGNGTGLVAASGITAAGAGNLTLTGNVTAAFIVANGGNLTNLNAGNLSTGTVSTARLHANVVLSNAANTFTANQIFGNVTIEGLALGNLEVQLGGYGQVLSAVGNRTLEVHDAENVIGSVVGDLNGGYLNEGPNTISINVRAFRDEGGVRVYSPHDAESNTIDGSGEPEPFNISWDWDDSTSGDEPPTGYLLTQVINGSPGAWRTVAVSNLNDDNTGWEAVVPRPAIAPVSFGTDGDVLATRQIGGAYITGDGGNLTNLSAASLAGTISTSVLHSNVALTNTAKTWTANQTFGNIGILGVVVGNVTGTGSLSLNTTAGCLTLAGNSTVRIDLSNSTVPGTINTGNAVMRITTTNGTATAQLNSGSVIIGCLTRTGIGANVFELYQGSNIRHYKDTNQLTLANTVILQWESGASVAGSVDCRVQRVAAGVLGNTTTWIQNAPGTARVAANVTSSNTTMANMTGISINVAAGRKYAGQLTVKCNNSQAAEGIKFDFDGGNATMTNFWAAASTIGTVTSGVVISEALATDLTFTSVTGEAVILIRFSFVVNAAGTFIARFAENSTASGTATVELGTFLSMEDIN